MQLSEQLIYCTTKIINIIDETKIATGTGFFMNFNENIESNSIVNQRELIDQYISSKEDLELVDYYIDDGYSGTNFNRPGFERLLKDMKIKRLIV